jgi:protein-S-isoprenylcysteine O-methyltransferase Ste14
MIVLEQSNRVHLVTVGHVETPFGECSFFKANGPGQSSVGRRTQEKANMDFKALGYFISTASVLFLGVVAWPKPGEPAWHSWAVGIGMATSILGMCSRYYSHRKDRAKIREAKQEAEQKQSASNG